MDSRLSNSVLAAASDILFGLWIEDERARFYQAVEKATTDNALSLTFIGNN